ncbi:MAG TPA: VCBS repeat-containing protein [Deltaproteobacteria bacterium]|nr:VCBS repeat-containing protein [Deltaproteobacteria bacterium]
MQNLVDTPDGPAYADIVDINGDGKQDLVVAAFGTFTGFGVPKGTVKLHHWGSDLSDWSSETLIAESDNVAFPNQPKAVDMDGDGDLDITIPTGFFVCTFIGGRDCGGVMWLEQTDAGAFTRREILPNDNLLFYHHMEVVDFDGDGIDDVVTTGEEMAGFLGGVSRAETVWFKGRGGGDYDSEPLPISQGLGSFPQVLDVDGDGDLDVIGAEYFNEDAASYTWLERTADPSTSNPSGTFVRHVISDTHGPAIQFQIVPDLYGDGVMRALGSNHTNTAKRPPDAEESVLAVFTPGSDPRDAWSDTVMSDRIVSDSNLLVELAAPGIFDYGDIDGDGDLDILLAGDGDPRVFWYEQTTPGSFTQHVLLTGMRQTGGARIGDIDGDGCNDLVVTSYEDNVVYVYGR